MLASFLVTQLVAVRGRSGFRNYCNSGTSAFFPQYIVMFFYDKTDFKILCMIRGKPLNPYFSGLYVAPLEVPAGWEVPGVSLKPTGDVARSF